MNLLTAPAHRVVLGSAFLPKSLFPKRSSRWKKSPSYSYRQSRPHNSATGLSSSIGIRQPLALQCRRKQSLLSEGCVRDVGMFKASVNFMRGLFLASVPDRRCHEFSRDGSVVSEKDDCDSWSKSPSPSLRQGNLSLDHREGSAEDSVNHSDDDDELEGSEVQGLEVDGLWDVEMKAKEELKSGLYLVGTPIGNLEDITLRALRVLKSATYILAEDTRHSSKLLRHYGIRTPTTSYHKFNEYSRIRELIQRLQRGEVLALISDAGMPGISDPGSELVRACVEVNVQVFPIPGPSAALTALIASGLPTDKFAFVGFLSAQASSRQKQLSAAAKESATQIFYVPPHKLCRVLDDFISAFGSSRQCVVAREMTKLHEEFWRSTLEEAKAEFQVRHPRGEVTLIVEGLRETVGAHQKTEAELLSRLKAFMDAGESPSEATKLVVEETSARRNTVYSLALEISRKSK